MARLKFLVFAVITLGLWGYHLSLISPAVSSQATDQAGGAVVGAPAAVALRVETQRSALQAAVLSLTVTPGLLSAGPKGAKEPLTPDRFNAVRAAVGAALGDDQAAAVVALVNETGALVAEGAAEPAAPPEGFDVAALTQAASGTTVAPAYGTPHLFYAVPLFASANNDVKPAGHIVVGLPVLPDSRKLVESVAKELRLSAVGVTAGGALVASAGPEKGLLEKAAKLKAGQIGPVSEGPVGTLGPLSLPIFVAARVKEIAVAQPIEGTPYTVVAVASTRASLENLADYQKFALGGLLGLALLMIAVVVVLGYGEDDGIRMVAPPPVMSPPSIAKRDKEPAPLAVPPIPAHQEAPEASPDDFQFPDSAPAQAAPSPEAAFEQAFTEQSPPEVPAEDPYANAPPEPPPDLFASPPAVPTPATGYGQQRRGETPLPRAPDSATGPRGTLQSPRFSTAAPAPGQSLMDEDDGGVRTVAYPLFHQPPGTESPPPSEPEAEGEYNPDATRVAAVPQELIKAARAGTGVTGDRPQYKPAASVSVPRVQSVAPSVASVAPSSPGGEDHHFQEVFREFLATRERCGEAADGLTYEKFRAKLLKNKEQLVQKYSCRTVRFQVYVKDGKAALKATPVKD